MLYLFDRLREFFDWRAVSAPPRVPHVWTLWDVVDRPATGDQGQCISGLKRAQVRRCVRCGLTEEQALRPMLFDQFPDCVRDENVDRRIVEGDER